MYSHHSLGKKTGIKRHNVNINRFNKLALTSECMTACFMKYLEYEEMFVTYATSLPVSI
jgi:hypothetical protein